MKTHWLAFLVLGLVLSACSRNNPSSDDRSWMETQQGQGQDKKIDQGQMHDKSQPGGGQGDENKSLTNHIIEWKSVGLTDDQIRRKTQEAAGNPSIVPGAAAFTEDELEQLRKAGLSVEVLGAFKELEFVASSAPDPATGSKDAPAADAPAADAPAADAPAADAPAADAPAADAPPTSP